ncbi:MAG: PEP-CTERM sorting domain-containing protein [Candidatus Thiodiazotropha sp. (ex Epidulcina cf. delphinae)]|nr:PEP-CTERM sorting domain-containing protein [Candidatus Thiodiazotropha sp. (ex Epidulcina cf. delphinae)]
MKSIFLISSLTGTLILNPISASAGTITHYNIDFDAPTHSVGSAPSTGTGSDQVSRVVFGTPTVEASFAGTPSQSLDFEAATSTYEQIELNMGQGYDNYQLSFDFYSENLAGSDYAFTMLADTPSVRNLSFHGSSGIRYWGGVDGVMSGGSFSNDTSYNILLDYDLIGEQVSIWLDGGLLGSNTFTTSGDDIESFRFALSPWRANAGLDHALDVDLDNILVTSRTAESTSVPEPGTFLLLLFGLSGLVAVRRKTG